MPTVPDDEAHRFERERSRRYVRERLFRLPHRPTCIGRYELRRKVEMFNFVLLTQGLLWLSRYPRLAEWAVGRMARHPLVFQKLLGINCGHYTFRDVRLKDVGQLLLLPGS